MKDDSFDNLLDDQFDPTEIDRIQAEIERKLNPKPQEPIQSPDEALPVVDENECGKRECVESSVVSEQSFGSFNAIDAPIEPNSFFKESVKHSNGSGFKRTAILVCVAAILCGVSVGAMLVFAGNLFGTGAQMAHSTFAPAGAIEPNFSFVGDLESEDVVYSAPIYGVMSFANLIDNVRPSVVCITAYKEVNAPSFFPTPGADSGGRLAPHSGSGIIFDKDDYRLFIVTNNHVIMDAERVTVSINGTDEVNATFMGRDFDSDLAVLSVSIRDFQAIGVNDFTVAAFADSDSMRIGDFVIAIGNALGRGNVATFGFVSAVNAEVYAYGRTFTMIQTDAAINPGNSGGALINLRGEVIGINMLKYVGTDVEGTGYAITSNVAMPIIERIRNQQPRPLLGIQGTNMTETISRAFSLPMMGIIVESVFEGSGAYNAGIRHSDIITSFGGYPVLSMENLSEMVQSHSIGDVVDVTIIRDGRDVIELEVTLLENVHLRF